jgi:hypothetical protein
VIHLWFICYLLWFIWAFLRWPGSVSSSLSRLRRMHWSGWRTCLSFVSHKSATLSDVFFIQWCIDQWCMEDSLACFVSEANGGHLKVHRLAHNLSHETWDTLFEMRWLRRESGRRSYLKVVVTRNFRFWSSRRFWAWISMLDICYVGFGIWYLIFDIWFSVFRGRHK